MITAVRRCCAYEQVHLPTLGRDPATEHVNGVAPAYDSVLAAGFASMNDTVRRGQFKGFVLLSVAVRYVKYPVDVSL